MGRSGGVARERLGPAQADRELENLERVQQTECRLESALDVDRKRRAGARALCVVDLAGPAVRRQQAQRMDLANTRMLAQEARYRGRVAARRGHAQRHGLERTAEHPARMRIEL